MSGEQRMTQQWTIKVNGVDIKSVKPGESVEIGRKPLRPLPDDGHERLEIQDGTRSMSKRHALFTVSAAGSGTIRDLGSTNGSYVVRGNGDLMRLPVRGDFLIPTSPIRMQFGDVPVDFVRVSQPVSEKFTVPDLFGYAPDTVKQEQQEPDAADMSVDDILDLRAGEPTAAFSSETVRRRVRDLNAGLASGLNGLVGREGSNDDPEPDFMPIHVPQDDAKTPDASPRDLFADAALTEAPKSDAVESGVAISVAEETVVNEQRDTTSEPTDRSKLNADGQNVTDQNATDQNTSTENVTSNVAASESEANQHAVDHVDAAASVASVVNNADNTVGVVVTGHNGSAHNDAENTDSQRDTQTQSPQAQPSQAQPNQTQPEREIPDEHRRFAEPTSYAESTVQVASQVSSQSVQPDETTTFTPMFEPGSVFERVSKGEFRGGEPRIEAGGYTSDEAKSTSDFTEQFEIARHPQLLPFLAMNPSLYDDLYAWLAAQGNADIDAALSKNAGYRDYREAVGK